MPKRWRRGCVALRAAFKQYNIKLLIRYKINNQISLTSNLNITSILSENIVSKLSNDDIRQNDENDDNISKINTKPIGRGKINKFGNIFSLE